jgi:hypothetical protein
MFELMLKTGFAAQQRTDRCRLGDKVIATVITSSPEPIPGASNARRSAEVPLVSATHYLACSNLRKRVACKAWRAKAE